MTFQKWLAVCALGSTLFRAPLLAQEPAQTPAVDALERRGYSTFAVTPVFSQLVAVGLPQGFRPLTEDASPTAYILQFVPQNETGESWTQRIQIIGARNATATPELFLTGLGERFRSYCPQSFAGHSLGRLEVSGHQAIAALLGCGVQETKQSEVALVVVIKGRTDLYTIQWIERRDAQERPTFDEQLWKARFEGLKLAVCDPIPNEPAPYPSCMNRASGK